MSQPPALKQEAKLLQSACPLTEMGIELIIEPMVQAF